MHSPVSAQVENILLIVIIQLVIIMAAARVFGVIFRYLGQPQVCGEIAAGLILGPSLFGHFFPHLFRQVFQPSVGLVFSILSQIGLILLMFLIGLEFDFSHLRTHGHVALQRSEEHTSELQSLAYLVCRLLLEKKKSLALTLDSASTRQTIPATGF